MQYAINMVIKTKSKGICGALHTKYLSFEGLNWSANSIKTKTLSIILLYSLKLF